MGDETLKSYALRAAITLPTLKAFLDGGRIKSRDRANLEGMVRWQF